MNRDVAILDDGREVPVADFGYGELLVLCMRGRIKCIRHFTAKRSRSAGAFRKRQSKPLTASQVRCVEGV